jgi:hypothetical protein
VEDARQYGIIPGLLDRRAKLDEEDFLETARLIEDVQERPGFVALLELLADAKRLYEGELYGRKDAPVPRDDAHGRRHQRAHGAAESSGVRPRQGQRGH